MDAFDSAQNTTELVAPERLAALKNVRWHKAPEAGELDLAATPPRMLVVKHGQHRTVYRVDWSQGNFFLKHQRCLSVRDVLRNLIRPSGSRREYAKAAELTRRDIPTVHAVAWGERREFGLVREHCLLTEAVPQSCSLADYAEDRSRWVSKRAQPAFERQLCVQLAELCAKAHRAGVWHDDLHPGNILLRLETPPSVGRHPKTTSVTPRLYLIDVPGVRLSQTMSWRQSRGSLVMLLAAVDALSSSTQRMRFWRHYLESRTELAALDGKQTALDIVRRSRRWMRSLARRRDKRSMATNRDYYCLKVAGGRGHAVREFDAGFLKRLVESPHALIEENIELPLKISHSSIVVEAEVSLAGRLRHVLYKRAGVTNFAKWVTSFFRQSRAEQSWRLGQALRVRGIATARPLAIIIPRFRFSPRVSYLVTEWIDGAQDFHQFAWYLNTLGGGERFNICRQVAENLGKLVGRMHEAYVTHRDLKGCNILITRDGDAVQCYLIDMHGVQIRRFLSGGRRVQNLARLALSAETHPWITLTMRLRFLKTYCRAVGMTDEWKPLWRQIATRTQWLIGRNHRRGKPIA